MFFQSFWENKAYVWYLYATEGFCRACTGLIQGNERTWDLSRKPKKKENFSKILKILGKFVKGRKKSKI